ncbi:TPA: hypothetical protein ACOFD0_002267 [Stenotrophomonas maltophilia]|uniref:hypothetical protein n=1 Tax=Stenotrophomonas maltophilia TaxID=40324 RepID=UPI000ADEF8E0|nr:hypothetical protein [Stenotrophomonas maltophilia]MCO7495085.1 hypothetical protein [Stenotrophomonas maltophilia]
MKWKVVAIAGALLVTSVSGCATKRYGRLQPLTGYETLNYSCDLIRIELAKVDAFDRQVEQQAKFSGMSVASFLGDFGIGNVIERNEAKRTSVERRAQLQGAFAAKRCGDVEVPRVEAPGPAAIAPSAVKPVKVDVPPASSTNSWWESHKPKGE